MMVVVVCVCVRGGGGLRYHSPIIGHFYCFIIHFPDIKDWVNTQANLSFCLGQGPKLLDLT